MATALTIEKITRGTHLFKWIGLAQAETGAVLTPQIGAGTFADRCVTITGTFGTATVDIQGSNDGVAWKALESANNAGTSLAGIAAAALHQILENPAYIRPVINGGNGTTDLDIIICGRAIMQLR